MVAWQTGKRRRDPRRGPLSVPLALEMVGCAEPAVPTNASAFFVLLETQAAITRVPLYFAAVNPAF